MVFDSHLGWKLLPNVTKRYPHENQPYTVRTNSRGLRDKEYPYEKPASIFRVIILGDSQTFGAGGVDSAETFPKLLENSDSHLQVINMGVPAYSTDQEYLSLQYEGVKYHPDVVVLAVFVNDFFITFHSWDNSILLPKGYFTLDHNDLKYHLPRASELRVWSRWSYICGALTRRFRRLTRSRSWQPAPEFNQAEREEIFRHLLTGMHNICKSVGAEFMVVYIPFKSQKERHFLQDIIAEAGLKDGFQTLDLTGLLFEADSLQPAYISNDIHLNQRGHRVVAEALRGAIVEAGRRD